MNLMKDIKLNKLSKILLAVSFLMLAFILGVNFQKVENLKLSDTLSFSTRDKPEGSSATNGSAQIDKQKVLPSEGFTLPISWGDLGPRLIAAGVIDKDKFISTVNLNSDEEKILKSGSDDLIVINQDNSQFVVDLLWAIGLAQESNAYTTGPLGTDYKDQVGNFASTGGWNLSRGEAVNYLGKYNWMNLSSSDQERVEAIAKNIYRPCCGNSTWFPDCNHGMAALAAIEMMVAKNMSDDEIYRNVLKLNSFWFPTTYLTTATYFANEGVSWEDVDAKKVLSAEYSSSQGAAQIAKRVGPVPGTSGGGSCGA